MQYLFNSNNRCTKAPQYYVIRTFLSLSQRIKYCWLSPPQWLTICLIPCREYSEAIFEHRLCSVIKEQRLKKASSVQNRNSWWIRLCNSTWKPFHALIWAANDKKDIQTQYSPINPQVPNVKTAEAHGQIAQITRKQYCSYFFGCLRREA